MNIGLIAHDSKKKLMQNFCIAYRGILCKHTLYATGTTGRLIEEAANLSVYKYLAGHLGGEQQMASQIEQNQLDLLIFLKIHLIRSAMNLMFTRLYSYVTCTIFHLQQMLLQLNY